MLSDSSSATVYAHARFEAGELAAIWEEVRVDNGRRVAEDLYLEELGALDAAEEEANALSQGGDDSDDAESSSDDEPEDA